MLRIHLILILIHQVICLYSTTSITVLTNEAGEHVASGPTDITWQCGTHRLNPQAAPVLTLRAELQFIENCCVQNMSTTLLPRLARNIVSSLPKLNNDEDRCFNMLGR